MRGILFGLLVIAGLGAGASTVKTPYTDRLDLSLVEKALKTPPDKLVAFIESQGVRVFKIEKAQRLSKPANPIFQKVVVAPAKDLERCDMDSNDDATEDGRFFQKDLTFCESDYSWIAIADTSSSLTLIHEFMHFLFYRFETPADRAISGDVAERIRREHRSLIRNYGALSADEDLMKQDRYRDGFIESCLDFSRAFVNGVRLQLSEEVLIERILEKLSVGSIYFNADRIQKGKTYAQNNLNAVAEMMVDYENIYDWLLGLRSVLGKTLTVEQMGVFAAQLEKVKSASQSHYQMHQELTDFQPVFKSGLGRSPKPKSLGGM